MGAQEALSFGFKVTVKERSQAETLKGFTLYFNSETFQSKDFHLFEVLDFLVQIQMDNRR